MALGSTQPPTEMSTRNLPGGEGCPELSEPQTELGIRELPTALTNAMFKRLALLFRTRVMSPENGLS
jgi:hypothetical protein